MRWADVALVAAALVAIASTAFTIAVAAARLAIAELALLVVAVPVLAKALARTVAILALVAPFADRGGLGAGLNGRLFVLFAEIAPSMVAMPLALLAVSGLARRASRLLARLAVVRAMMMAVARLALVHAAAGTPHLDQLRFGFRRGRSRFNGGSSIGRRAFGDRGLLCGDGFRGCGFAARNVIGRCFRSCGFLMRHFGSGLDSDGGLLRCGLFRHSRIGFDLDRLLACSRRRRDHRQQPDRRRRITGHHVRDGWFSYRGRC